MTSDVRQRGVSRREAMKLGAAAAIGAGISGCATPVAARTTGSVRNGVPRNIIFMVSDGMSIGVPTLTEPFKLMVREGKSATAALATREASTHWRQLAEDPHLVHGQLDMGSLNALVTDSAAAASSWGSGSRVFNGALNMLPDGTALTPLYEVARQAGKRTGLVTTTTVTHATPAGFAAAIDHRNKEDQIAEQYLGRVDVALGGGRRHFNPQRREDQRDLVGEFRQHGYTVMNHRDELRQALNGGATPAKILGTFSGGHLPYTIDTRDDPSLDEQTPTLAEMTRLALRSLAQGRDGFILQIEGGRVDHAAHANDTGAILWDQLAFDDAIGEAREFAERDGDTLVIVTSDHGNANPGLNGMGGSYRDTNAHFENVLHAKRSYASLLPPFYEASSGLPRPPIDAVIEIIRDVVGCELSPQEAEAVALGVQGRGHGNLSRQIDNYWGALGAATANFTGVGWTGTSHTADWTLLTAFGPGAETFAGLHRNTHVFPTLTRFMGVEFRNPSLDPLEAQKRFAAAAPRVTQPDWA
jgi:alkaline phosphatase